MESHTFHNKSYHIPTPKYRRDIEHVERAVKRTVVEPRTVVEKVRVSRPVTREIVEEHTITEHVEVPRDRGGYFDQIFGFGDLILRS
jgi:hypothetical protein